MLRCRRRSYGAFIIALAFGILNVLSMFGRYSTTKILATLFICIILPYPWIHCISEVLKPRNSNKRGRTRVLIFSSVCLIAIYSFFAWVRTEVMHNDLSTHYGILCIFATLTVYVLAVTWSKKK